MLQGTTGSGKTLVYFEALKTYKTRISGVNLLPEIGLTGQFEKKFNEYLVLTQQCGIQEFTKKKKELIWSGISNGEVKAIIGARSSLFYLLKI